MFCRNSDNTTTAITMPGAVPGGAFDGEIIRFSGPRGKNNLARIGAYQSGDIAARGFHHLSRALPCRMGAAVRIGKLLPEQRHHGRYNARIARGSGRIIEIKFFHSRLSPALRLRCPATWCARAGAASPDGLPYAPRKLRLALIR
ncbi:hypothetical protein AA21952_2789 [Acetobacter oeni LMG 21952]|nr:hypothetical protein AA21952_2789 [Acetobacter oeni LMG 21952]